MVLCVNGVLDGWIHIAEIYNLWLRALGTKTTGYLILIQELKPVLLLQYDGCVSATSILL